jgi:predicted nucleotidyltransferase component of viral defense system
MKNKNVFVKKVDLLLNVLPYVMSEKNFGLKGGTAINLFMRNMPRLSVDIDLTYLPIEDREISLNNIDCALTNIYSQVELKIPGVKGFLRHSSAGHIKQIVFEKNNTQVKVEINQVLRGCIYPPNILDLCEVAQTLFSRFVTVQTLSFEDVYAGKICAALDRQHPRDLFDIKLLLENEGISDKLRKAFIIYLISSNRPIVELIDPNFLNIEKLYKQELEGMTNISVSYKELIEVRELLVSIVNKGFTERERGYFCYLLKREIQNGN